MRLSRHDDSVDRIEDTRVFKLLDYWVHEKSGNGLTANSICYLTKQSWPTVRSVLTRYTDTLQIFGMYCHEVKAPVFYPHRLWSSTLGNMLSRNGSVLEVADRIISKYPPQKYPGAMNDKGQKTLTFFKFERYDDDEYLDEYDNWCGDVSCCPEPKRSQKSAKALAKDLAKKNRQLVRELKSCWK